MRKFLLLGILFIDIFCGSCSSDDNTYKVTAKSGLKVKETPGGGATLAVLANGEKVEVLDISNGWAKIDYSGKEAYVSAKYISKGVADKSSEDEEDGWVLGLIILAFAVLGGGGTAAAVHLKKDGTPDMRFKSNR